MAGHKHQTTRRADLPIFAGCLVLTPKSIDTYPPRPSSLSPSSATPCLPCIPHLDPAIVTNMHDPFPIAPPAGIATNYIPPFADYFGLKTLPLHFHEVAIAFVLYHATNKYLAPAASRFFFPRIYPTFNARTKLNWDVHIVSFVQSTLINILALWVIWTDEERADMNWEGRVFGYTGGSGLIQGFAAGYFVWDLMITLQNVAVFGPGMLAHAVSALFVFSLGFVGLPHSLAIPPSES